MVRWDAKGGRSESVHRSDRPDQETVLPRDDLVGTAIDAYTLRWWLPGGSMGRQSYGSPMECLGIGFTRIRGSHQVLRLSPPDAPCYDVRCGMAQVIERMTMFNPKTKQVVPSTPM